MGERTSYPPGTFCWAEPATSGAEGAKAFYQRLFGWEDLDASLAQIGTSGGGVLFGPMAIDPGRIAGAMDPQGAVFALFEGTVDP